MKSGKTTKQADSISTKATKANALKKAIKSAAAKLARPARALKSKAESAVKSAVAAAQKKLPASATLSVSISKASAKPSSAPSTKPAVKRPAPAISKSTPSAKKAKLPPPAPAPAPKPAPRKKAAPPKSASPAPAPSQKTAAAAPSPSPISPPAVPLAANPAPQPLLAAKPSVPGPPSPKPRPTRQPRPVPIEIPAILLEPDHVPSSEPVNEGPGFRFARGDAGETPVSHAPLDLPDSYGTKQIFLAARDPFWLLASWDLDAAQRSHYAAHSASGALTIRLRRGDADGPIQLEIHPQQDSKDWFIHAGEADATFVAELGYHERNSGSWRRISVSKPASTPRATVAAPPPAPAKAEPTPVAAVDPTPASPVPEPAEAPQPAAPVEEIIFALPNPPSAPTSPARGEEPPPSSVGQQPESVALQYVAPPRWTEAQTRALDELISLELRRLQQGSLEIEEMLKRGSPAAGPQSAAPSSLDLLQTPGEDRIARALGLARPGAPSSLESGPASETRGGQGFWLKVNAELILYGSTEPSAHVSIGGRTIRLRADGSFSYRFALPDGAYELPVIALSHDGGDCRVAELNFARATRLGGEVGTHPQDPCLKPPVVGSL